MGVDIGKILKVKEMGLDHLSDRIIAMDAYNIIYQFLASIRQRDGTPLMDSNQNITSHLSGLLYRNANLLENDIKLVYVFDGEPDVMKEGTLEKRLERKQEAKKEYEKALEEGDMEKARSKAQQTSRMSPDIVKGSKRLLELMGIPWVQAPAEGEAQAAHIVIKGDAWAVGGQDYDSLLCGAPRLIRNLTISGRRKLPGKNKYKKIQPEMISLQDNLNELDITREQLVDIALLCGTDYNDGIKGIGPKRGIKKIKKHGSLEAVLDSIQEDINNAEAIKKLFLDPKVTDDYKIEFQSPDFEGMISFLCDEREFSESRVKSALEKFENKRTSQSDLLSFT